VDRYFRLSPQERTAYLDKVLDTLSQWKTVEQLRPSGGTSESSSFVGQLLQWVRQWQDRAEPHRRDQIGQFLVAVQARWMIRSI
jgi:hypothetical protein